MSEALYQKHLNAATQQVRHRDALNRLDDPHQGDSGVVESVSGATNDEGFGEQLPPMVDRIAGVLRSAEREISSFYQAVLRTYGVTQARVAAEDWLELMEHSETPTGDPVRYWRRVTITAADRLATRICNLAEA